MEKPIQTGALGATLAQIAAKLGGELLGPDDFLVTRLASADDGDPSGLAFAESKAYAVAAKRAGVGALLVGPDVDPDGVPAIRVPNPRLAFLMLLTATDHPYPNQPGIHPSAVISPAALVDEGVEVGPYAVVEAGATLKARVRVYAHAYVGECCEVGEDAVILPHAVLLRNVTVGARSVVFPGAVLGADGFGFVWDGRRQVKVPQVGRVEIGEDCEIGAMTAIDRATAGSTTIGRGTKLDNFVQVAHNCKIGEDTVIAACSAMGGTTSIGDRCTLAGSTRIADHAVIGSDIVLGGLAGVSGRLTEPGAYLDYPATPYITARKNLVLRTKLVDIVDRIRALEARIRKIGGELE